LSVSRSTSQVIRFGPFELTLDTGELRRAGRLIKLPPQPSKVLVEIVNRAGRLVTREEIRQKVWGEETFVDFETGLNHCINQIRTALGDNADKPRYVETVPRRGYRFIAPVEKADTLNIGFGEETPAPPAFRSEGPATASDLALPAAAAEERKGAFRQLATLLATAIILTLVAITLVRLRPSRTARLTDKDTIILGELTNRTGDPVFDGTLRQALAIELEQSPYLYVLPDRRMTAVLKEMGRSEGDRFTPDVTREICLRTNSAAYLSGSIAKLGDHYLIGLTALQCATDETLASGEVEAKSRNEVVKALGDLGNQIRKRFGESLTSVAKFDKPLAEATTSSLEALQAFTMARNVQREKGDAASIPYAKRAMELDPNFAQGYATLGLLYRNLGERALAVENLKKAYALRDRVTQRERFFIETAYYSFVTGDLEQANATFTEWTQTYPRDASPHVNLAVNYMRMGDYGNALEQVKMAHVLAPDNGNVYANLMASYLGLNRLDEAKAACGEARAHNVESQHLRANRYIVAFLQNDSPGMKEQLDAAMGRPGFEDMLLQAQSDTEAYYGRLGTAREFTHRAVDAATNTNALETAAEYKATEALREAEVGNATVARTAALNAVTLNSAQEVESIAALALARAGDMNDAARMAGKLSRLSPQDTILQRYIVPTVEAAIALDSKQYQKAIQMLEVTAPYERSGFSFSSLYPAYVRGLAYLEAKQAPEASEEFRKLLEQRGIVQNSVLGALTHLQLARTGAMAGDLAVARKEYAEFLELWKNADPNLPILRQAKLEYAGLQ
jgi:eukaryotic-like serine/threonine-protein kinase